MLDRVAVDGVRRPTCARPGPWQRRLAWSGSSVHTAALVSQTAGWDDAWSANVVATRRVLDAMGRPLPGCALLVGGRVLRVQARCGRRVVAGASERTDLRRHQDRVEQVVLAAHHRRRGRHGDPEPERRLRTGLATVDGGPGHPVPGRADGAARPWAWGRRPDLRPRSRRRCGRRVPRRPTRRAVFNLAGGAPVTTASSSGVQPPTRPRAATLRPDRDRERGRGDRSVQRGCGRSTEMGAGRVAMLAKTGLISPAQAVGGLGWVPRVTLADGMEATVAAMRRTLLPAPDPVDDQHQQDRADDRADDAAGSQHSPPSKIRLPMMPPTNEPARPVMSASDQLTRVSKPLTRAGRPSRWPCRTRA